MDFADNESLGETSKCLENNWADPSLKRLPSQSGEETDEMPHEPPCFSHVTKSSRTNAWTHALIFHSAAWTIKIITRETQFIDLTQNLWFERQTFGLCPVPDSFPLSVTYVLSFPSSNNSNHTALTGQIFRADIHPRCPLSMIVVPELSCPGAKVHKTHTEALITRSVSS